MNLDPDYKTDQGNASGTETSYAVEARYNYPHPVEIDGQLFDNRWRRVSVTPLAALRTAWGGCLNRRSVEHGLLTYAESQAARWSLYAVADLNGLRLETRLIEMRLEWSYTITAVAIRDVVTDGLYPKKEITDGEETQASDGRSVAD